MLYLEYIIKNGDTNIIDVLTLYEYNELFPEIENIRIKEYFKDNRYTEVTKIEDQIVKDLKAYSNLVLKENKKYMWVIKPGILNKTNPGVYLIAKILAINVVLFMKDKYKKGEKWSDIYNILKFRKIDEVIEYLGYSAITDEDKEEAIEKMHEKALEYIEKQIEVL